MTGFLKVFPEFHAMEINIAQGLAQANGILHVKASDLGSGSTCTASCKSFSKILGRRVLGKSDSEMMVLTIYW